MKNPIILAVAVTVVAIHTAMPQGSLTPPGVPAPTMKTLEQLEPRTLINAANTPGDADNQFIISAPGSYYLAGNLTGEADKDGIRITADDVTLDLNGFAVIGVAGSRKGIVTGSVRNIAVRRGTVRNWGFTGLDAELSVNSTVELIRASNNGTGGPDFGAGISVGFGCMVSGCVSFENSSAGITCQGGATMTGCVAQGNGGTGFGDFFPGGSAFANCTARANGGAGLASAGGSTFTGCTAKANVGNGFSAGSDATLTGCTANENSSGIFCTNTSTISACTANRNRDHGIVVFGGCHIRNNTVCVNGTDGSGDGIQTIEAGNRIDGNHTASNAFRGIRSLGGAPFDDIIRNTSPSNGAGGYAPSSAARMGPLSVPNSATSPWANF